MQAHLQIFRRTLEQLRPSLKSFQESDARFRVVTSVDRSTFEPSQVEDDAPASTLFILDSSFNPPSIAHLALAERALAGSHAYPRPHRLLLLFGTSNADKAPAPASFDQRVTMMAILASDLLQRLSSQGSGSVPSVDIGVTKAPYYTDKSMAIEQEGPAWYGSGMKHVHLVGYDTLTRVFAAKYYKDFNPPLSALNPYFDVGHEMQATMRPGDDFGSLDEQKAFLEQLRTGGMEQDGAKSEWADQVSLVPPNPKAGVSSTKIRAAAKASDWSTVRALCPPTVAQWVEYEKLYQ